MCYCVAEDRNLTTRGPHSLLGTVLPERSDGWLNAGPGAWTAFTGDNGDIKFPQRLPVQTEMHEKIFDIKNNTCVRERFSWTPYVGSTSCHGFSNGAFWWPHCQDSGHGHQRGQALAANHFQQNRKRNPIANCSKIQKILP